MRPLKLILLLAVLGFVLSCKRAANQEPALNVDPEQVRPSEQKAEINYSLSTPDTLAFTGKTKCGTKRPRYKYCGYAYAKQDSSIWKPLPSFFRNNTDSAYGTITIREFNAMGEPVKYLSISRFELKEGNYLPSKELYPSKPHEIHLLYEDLDSGCSHHTSYYSDTTKQSFFKVISYDSTTKEIKARFKLYFKLKSADKPGYPETLFFDDGIVFAKRIN